MKAYRKRCARHFGRLGLALLLFYAVTALSQNGLYQICLFRFPHIIEADWFLIALSVLPMYLLGFPAFLLVLPKAPERALRPEKQRLRGGQLWTLLLICFAFLLPGNLLGRGLDALICRLTGSESYDPLTVMVSSTNLWVCGLATVVVAPLMEELVFRKLLLDRMRTIDKPSAMVYSALAFGLMHGNLQQFFYAFGIGLVFGAIYLRTGRLRYTVLLHMLVNFLGSMVTLLLYEGVDMNDPMSAILPVMGLGIYSLCLLTATVAGIVMLCRYRRFLRVGDGADLLAGHRLLPFITPGFLGFAAAIIAVTVRGYLS